MISQDAIQHVKAAVALGTTGAALPTAWLTDIDVVLRILLTLIGIATGIYSFMYYRKRYHEVSDGNKS